MNKKVNLEQKLSLIQEHWNPKIVGELNGQFIKLAKLKGEFVWHKHDQEDEMFLVLKGTLKIEFRDKMVSLSANEFMIVPAGVEHKPIAEQEVEIMLFEPKTTLNTGNVIEERTREKLDRI
jgi:mannose-6-phosphate isomerase-like protein (cupin superfamily)